MNEEELKKGVRKLWAAAAGTAVAAVAGTAACIFAAKCGIIARTSLLPASFAWTAVVFAAAIAWTSRTPNEVWRKVMDQLNRHVILVLGISFCLSALTDASLLRRAIKDKAKLDEISARLDEISTNALLRTDFASPTNDPPGMTLTEAASVLSNAYDRIRGMDDVDKAIPKISVGGAEADLETRVRWMKWQAAKAGLMRALEKGYLTQEAFEISVKDLGPMPEPKVFGTAKEVYRTEDENPPPPYYGLF